MRQHFTAEQEARIREIADEQTDARDGSQDSGRTAVVSARGPFLFVVQAPEK
ncbi:hypothetical protein [uncultured Sphingomonas sp.]|uniref:hypothetical protein n=1 Tax=uncultured Sphingomonas sp. TaxID=158754 RepID=UPI0037492137